MSMTANGKEIVLYGHLNTSSHERESVRKEGQGQFQAEPRPLLVYKRRNKAQ